MPRQYTASPSLGRVVDAALGDHVHRLLLGAPRRVGDLADARVALALAQRDTRVRRVREHVPAHRLLGVRHKPATYQARPGAESGPGEASRDSCGAAAEGGAWVGVAAQYAAIAPGSAQTWLVKTTARLNCEAIKRRHVGWRYMRRGARGHGGTVGTWGEGVAPQMQARARGTRLLSHLLERDENGTEPLLPLRQLATPGKREQGLGLRRARGAAGRLQWVAVAVRTGAGV